MSGRRPAPLDSSLLARKGAAAPAVPDDSPLVLQLDEHRNEAEATELPADEAVHLLTAEVTGSDSDGAAATRGGSRRRVLRRWGLLGAAGAVAGVALIVWLAAPAPTPPGSRTVAVAPAPAAETAEHGLGLTSNAPEPAAEPSASSTTEPDSSKTATPAADAAQLPAIAAQAAIEPASGANLATAKVDEGPAESSPPALAREPILPVKAPPHDAEPPAREADAAPGISATVPKSVAPLPKAKPKVAQAPAGIYAVQLASIAVEAKARQEAFRLEKRLGDVLGGREITIEKATVANRATYRLRVGGFASIAEARATCARVTRLKVDCLALRR